MHRVVQRVPSAEIVNINGMQLGIGDCVTAATASILGVPYEDVPDLTARGCFLRGESQTGAVMRFFREQGFGCDLVYDKSGFGNPWPCHRFDSAGLAVTMGYLSPFQVGRPEALVTHTVVTLNGQIFWDPFPAGCGLSVGPMYAWMYLLKDGKRVYP